MAFFCEKTSKHWHDAPDVDKEKYCEFTNLVEMYRLYRRTRAKLEYLFRLLASRARQWTNNTDNLLLELQCQQVLLWIHTRSIARMMSDSKNAPGNPTLQLDLIIHAHSLRTLMKVSSVKYSEQNLADTLELRVKAKREDKIKTLSSFEKIFVDQELEDLCRMDSVRFRQKVRQAIHEGIHSLSSPIQSSSRRRTKGRTSLLPNEGPLNKKMSRANDPWRNGCRVVGIEADHGSDCDDCSNKRHARWKKGKSRVSARRSTVLDTSTLMV